MKRICIVTSTRAEYGLLKPIIDRILADVEFELDLVVTGAHLSERFGHTIDDIINDGIPIAHEIPIIDKDNTPFGISVTMANALKGFAQCFRDDRPDLVVILGDRTEMLGVASAAMNERIPIAHIHGGEVTEGAVDDCIRHSITKMSYLHFTSSEVYRKRVIQLGESPERVFNVGSLGAENIMHQKLMTEENIRNDIGIPDMMDYAVVTFHPVTLECDAIEQQIGELCRSISEFDNLFFVITGSNADAGGDKVNALLRECVDSHDNMIFVHNLGSKRYLSAMKFASFVLGNSSSGIIEAPVFGTPSINLGDRQKGRLMAETVINVDIVSSKISDAIEKAIRMEHRTSLLFGNGNTSQMIIRYICCFFEKDKIELKKGFYNL